MSDPKMIKMIVVLVFITGIVITLSAAILVDWLESRKKKLLFHQERIYPEDVKRIQREKSVSCKEKQRSEFFFQGEQLYELDLTPPPDREIY